MRMAPVSPRLGGMRVLVATDGSASAEAAVRFAARIAAASRARLFVLNVGSLPARLLRRPSRADLGLASTLNEAERLSSQRALESARRAAERQGARFRCDYRTGGLEPIAETISRAAERERADLVVVGSRGGNPLARWALGSIANRLVHTARRPVAVVRPGNRGSSHRAATILVATDGSPAAVEAVRFGARLAAAIPGARLVILTVSTLMADVALTGVGVVRALGAFPELKRSDRRWANRILDSAARQTRGRGRRVTTRYVMPPQAVFAGDAIVREARREGADLIVLGNGLSF